MKEKTKQKGFIQVPLFIVIIAVVLVSSGGYFGLKQYQKVSLKKTQKEIEKLENQQKTQRESQIEVKRNNDIQSTIEQNSSVSNSNLAITSAEFTPYVTGIGQVVCGQSKGSGSLWKLDSGYFVLTVHSLVNGATECTFTVSDLSKSDQKLEYRLHLGNMNSDVKVDIAFVQLGSPTDNAFLPVSQLNYKISALQKCPLNTEIGSPLAVMGFNGIVSSPIKGLSSHISGYDTSTQSSQGLPYPNYMVSVQIDSGNFGGIAFSKTQRGLCVLGVPTSWQLIGNWEIQGSLQNIHNVMRVIK